MQRKKFNVSWHMSQKVGGRGETERYRMDCRMIEKVLLSNESKQTEKFNWQKSVKSTHPWPESTLIQYRNKLERFLL